MVVRKNISLEASRLKKLNPLTEKHGGNLSAAIRDAIDITEAALHRFGTVEKAIAGITTEQRELTPREKSIETGKNVLLNSSVFLRMLKCTKGILIDQATLNDVLDPLKIKTISELDRQINEISRESGWDCEVSIFCTDNINPATATISVKGENEWYRDFLAHLVVMFLFYNKGLDIDTVHRRTTATRIDMSSRKEKMPTTGVTQHFGYLNSALEEFHAKEEFWKNLVELYRSANYTMVALYKDHYEELLACSTPPDRAIFESISSKHIAHIPHPDFLIMLKHIHELMQIVDKIEILDGSLNVYHNYKKEKAIKKIRDYYLSLLRENGHEYEADYTSSLIVFTHMCCRD